jgi:hypothetical protein
LGFDQLENARAYRFGVISRSEDDRKFIVTVDLALFRKHGVAIQEGPSLCARKLAADLELSAEGNHELTADDLRLFAQDRAAEEARKIEARSAGGRRPKPPVANAGSAWAHQMRPQETDMPFQGFRRYSFSAASIRQNAPNTAGVFGLSNANEWILVSSTDNLQAELLRQLNSAGTLVSSRMPTGFIFEPCPPEACLARRQRLIAELSPTCNGR